jgi:hypothetical protein
MNNINTWKIKGNHDDLVVFIDNYLKKGEPFNNYNLLNFHSNNNYDILENTVFQIASFHLNRLNIIYNENIHIEFWCKENTGLHNFHLDCDEYERIKNIYNHPLVSCLTYLNDNDCPTLITNVNHEQYMYKDFDTQTGFSLIYPEYGKHICFDGSKYHGVSSTNINFDKKISNIVNNRYILAINIWKDYKPTNVLYYNTENENIFTKTESKLLTFKEENKYHNIQIEDENKINSSFFDDLLYDNSNKKLLELDKWSNNYKNINILFKKKELDKIFNKNNCIKEDIDFIMKNNDYILNRFFQRIVIPKLFSKDICKWIISEGEKFASQNNGWTTNRHSNYPTMDLPIKDIPTIFSFILCNLPDLFEIISKSYNLNSTKMNVLDFFLVKYQENLQTELELHSDGSILSCNISLSDKSEYEGGGTLFPDGIHYLLDQGDMLIHCGKIKHTGIKVTKGNRYILVAFLDLSV